MADMQKDFRKVVKAFRDGQEFKSEYPKAMMTGQQRMKRTATVNLGSGDRGADRVEPFKVFEPFVKWCEAYGIKAVRVETVGNAYGNKQYQIRVTY